MLLSLTVALALLPALARPAAAQDECLLGPWRQPAPPKFASRAVTVETFADLQSHVDAAEGPTALLVRVSPAAGAGIGSGGRTLVIDKPDVVVTAAAAYDPGGGPFKGQRVAVSCGAAKTLVSIT